MNKLYAWISRPTRTINWLVFTWHFNVSVHVNLRLSPYTQKGWSRTTYTVPSKKATLTYVQNSTHTSCCLFIEMWFTFQWCLHITAVSPVTSHASMHKHSISHTSSSPCKANQQSMHSIHTHTTRNKLFGLHTLSNKLIEFSIHTEEMGVLVNH